MPIILDDEMLIPPSRRRKQYVDRSDGSVIELPPHEPAIEYAPIVMHQERFAGEPRPAEFIREREIIIDNGRPVGGGVRRYRRTEGLEIRRSRARSVGYASSTESDSDPYYLDDGGSSHSYAVQRHPRHLHDRSHRHRHPRHPPDSRVYTLEPQTSTTNRGGRGLRGLVAAGAGLLGANTLRHHHPHHPEEPWPADSYADSYVDPDPHRNTRHLAQAGLGLAAAGAAKELYDRRRSRSRRRRSHSRSFSSSSSRSRSRSHSRSHTGRNVAAAALGATAAGLAAQHHYARCRSGSYSSGSDGDGDSHHRGRKLAAGLAGATAAGLAASALHRRNRSRSTSASSSSSVDSRHSHRMRNVALGLGAAGLAARHHRRHKASRSRSRSRSRSLSRPGILRHRSRTHSPAGRHRHHMRGEKRVHYMHPHQHPHYGAGDASSIRPESSVSNHPSPRRSSGSGLGGMLRQAILPPSSTHSRPRSRSRGFAQDMAYRATEGAVEGLRRH
jgi:hypothetical protein